MACSLCAGTLPAQSPKVKPNEHFKSGTATHSQEFTLSCAGAIHTPTADLKWRPVLTTRCIEREPRIPDYEQFEKMKAQKTRAKQAGTGRNSGPLTELSTLAVTPVIGSNWPGNTNNGSSPLDNSMAISDGGIIVSVANTTLEVDDINGTLLYYNDLATFYNDPSVTNTCDPVVLYDRPSDRFILFFQECSGNSANSYLCICFSLTNNPATGGWWKYKITGNPINNNCWFDYPKMAISNNELYITGNLFNNNSQFNQAILYQIEKTNAYVGGNINWQYWNNIPGTPFTLLPVGDGQGAAYGPGCFLVATAASGASTIGLYDLTNDLSATNEQLNYYSVNTTAYSPAGDASQAGTSCLLNNGDCRSLSGFYLNGLVHFVFHSDIGGGWNGINYNRLNLSNLTNQSTTYGLAGSLDYSYPSVSSFSSSPSDAGVMIGFGRSGASITPEVRVVNCDNSLNWSASTLVKGSTSFVSYTSSTNERWGDYTGTARKHNSTTPSIWMNGMFGNSGNAWDTWIAEVYGSSAAGTTETATAKDFQLYPNPTAASFTVSFTLAETMPLTIRVYDIAGQLVKELYTGKGLSGENVFSFNKSALRTGTYFITIQNNERTIKNEKIVITE